MEGLNKGFTSELQTYVSGIKGVHVSKGISDCQIQTYNKTWQSIVLCFSSAQSEEF